MSSLEQALTRYRARVEAALDARLPDPQLLPQRLHQAMRYAVLDGGKRLRASLVYASGEAMGVDPARLDDAACAVEIIHAYSLVHDDLPAMDDDDLRRGKPTCHRAFGEATAILAGDALQCLAFQLVAQAPHLDPARRVSMIETLATAAGHQGMAGGQAIDLDAVGRELTLPELENMHIHKTGALIRAAVRLGVLAGGPDDAEVTQALDHYAKCLGLAFQIRDDILDVEGDTTTLGKSSGADRAREKPTYPSLLGLAEAKHQARELRDAALASLDGLGDNARILREIARYVVDRTY